MLADLRSLAVLSTCSSGSQLPFVSCSVEGPGTTKDLISANRRMNDIGWVFSARAEPEMTAAPANKLIKAPRETLNQSHPAWIHKSCEVMHVLF